jgi:rhodanese-related sulfurtransferase
MDQVLEFIQNHALLVSAWVVCLIAIIVTEIKTKTAASTEVSPQQLVELMNENTVKVIDIRSSELFKKSHILNAKNIPWNNQDEAAFKSLNQDKIVLVCQQGQTATTLAGKLQQQGMQDVIVLTGGLSAWQQQNLPLVKGK